MLYTCRSFKMDLDSPVGILHTPISRVIMRDTLHFLFSSISLPSSLTDLAHSKVCICQAYNATYLRLHGGIISFIFHVFPGPNLTVKIDSLVLQLLSNVIGHENKSQHYPDHRCLCLELSGRITTPDRFSYHTGCSQQSMPVFLLVVMHTKNLPEATETFINTGKTSETNKACVLVAVY